MMTLVRQEDMERVSDEVLRALKKAAEEQALIAKNGDYWLEYKKRVYMLTCEPWERCVDGQWAAFGKFALTFDHEERGETRRVQALGDVSTIQREVQRAIDTCFRELTTANNRAETQSRQFQEGCR